MNARILFTLAIVLLTSLASNAAETIDEARGAIRKSLTFLQADMQDWRAQQGCAACHHGPLYVWTAARAKEQGFAINEKYFAETAKWLVDEPDAKIFRHIPPPPEKPRFSLASAYLAHAMTALPSNHEVSERGWQRALEQFEASQLSNGSWQTSTGRLPIFEQPENVTRFTVLALQSVKQNPTRKRAEQWLQLQPGDESHQGLILRLWEASNQRNKVLTAKLVAQLRQLQQRDGGWRQSDLLSSDAYATGQTLFAWQRAGVPVNDPQVQRGIAFLVRTQQADGSWAMVSRPDPENGQPADYLVPITYAGSAWGTLGLLAYVRAEP